MSRPTVYVRSVAISLPARDGDQHLSWPRSSAGPLRRSARRSQAGLLDDPTLLTTLEVLLNVLPPSGAARRSKKVDPLLGGAAGDFEALERLRKLAFTETVPEPKQRDLFAALEGNEAGEDGAKDEVE